MRLKFGLSIVPQASISDQIRLAVLAEKLGYDSCWWPDHLVYIDQSSSLDCWTVMAAAAARTKRVLLGTSVSDCHRLHPAVFAQRAATLDQLSQGRLIVGLGSGEAMNLDPFGIQWKDHKVGRLREFIQIFRGLLDAPQRPFSLEGRFFQIRDALLSVGPYRGRKIPLQMASLGPQMQRLAGQWSDGWKPVAIPAANYASYFEGIAASAREAGRDPSQIDRGVPFAFALFEGRRPSLQQVAQAIRPFAGMLVWEPAVRQMGLEFHPPEHLKGVGYHTVNPSDPESWRLFQEYSNWLPDELLEKFVVYGDKATIRNALQAYIEAGVTHFEIINASPDPLPSLAWLAAEVIPHFCKRPPTAWARAAHAWLKPLQRLGLTRKVVPSDLDLWKKVGF